MVPERRLQGNHTTRDLYQPGDDPGLVPGF